MHHIRYFLAVSETLNLTKAAERCNVAQPALSRAIQDLESELGGELLRRERALSHLTELGQRMLPMLRQCYETAHAAKMVAASIRKGEAAPLSIAVSHTVALNRFTTMLRELSRAFPGLQLKMHRGSASEIAEFLKSGTVELAIAGPLGETWSRLDELPLFEEPFGLVVSRTHRLAGRNEAEFKDLASEKLLINTRCEMVEELKACLEANGILDTATHQVATQEDVLALLKADLGVRNHPDRGGGSGRDLPDFHCNSSISCAKCRYTPLPVGTARSLVPLYSICCELLTGASTRGRSNSGGLIDDGI
jgi:DNA-binding transcriptional LysR family regulator